MLATAWIVFGTVLLIGPVHNRFSREGPSPLDPLDSRWWGLLWITGGAVVITVILRRRNQDVLAFTALIGPALVWTVFYAWSLLVWLGTGGVFGEYDAWQGTLHWLMLSVIIWLVAGWPDQRTGPDPPPTG